MSADEREAQAKAKAVLVQLHQLNVAQQQVGKLSTKLDSLQNELLSNVDVLNEMVATAEMYIQTSAVEWIDDEDDCHSIDSELYVKMDEVAHQRQELDLLDYVDGNAETWNQYMERVASYAVSQNLDLTDPYKKLMSVSQRVELEKLIKSEFTLKTASCDKFDYMIAGTCGLIGGLIDVFLVGAPGEGVLGKAVDNGAKGAVGKFSEAFGFNLQEEESNGYLEYLDLCKVKNKNPLDKDTWLDIQAVQYLEDKFGINYDQTHTYKEGKSGTGGRVENLYPGNHHVKSLGHSPDLIGLFFSIYNQFTSTSSFVSNGQFITIDTETFELSGNSFVGKLFCGFVNWLGHLFSDMAGSNTSIAKGNRGTGIPIPFYNLLLLIDVGEFGNQKQTFASVATKVFENGYDFRHGVSMSIPVLIVELLTRFMWVVKQRFYHEKPWNECIPSANQPELRRMLMIAHGSLCLVDGADAAIRSGFELIQFMLRVNIIAWARFGTIALKELNAWYRSGDLDVDAVDEYLDAECNRLVSAA